MQKRGLHSSSRAESGSPLLAKSSSPARGKDASCPKAFCGGSCKVPVDLAATDIGGEVEGRLGKGSQTCCKRIIRQESHEHNPVGDRGWTESSNRNRQAAAAPPLRAPPPAPRPLSELTAADRPLRCWRLIVKSQWERSHRETAAGSDCGTGRQRRRRRRRRRRSRLQAPPEEQPRPPLRAPLEELGPGRESELESGPQPEREPRPGLPAPPPLSRREPSPGFKSAGSWESRAGRRAKLPATIRALGCRGARSRAGRSQPFRKAALESGRQPARKITHFALFVVRVAPGSLCLLLSGGDGRGRKIRDNSRQRRIHSEIGKKIKIRRKYLRKKGKRESERDIQSRSNK